MAFSSRDLAESLLFRSLNPLDCNHNAYNPESINDSR